MAKTRATKRKIIPNPELEKALKGYSPEFGNQEDMALVNRMAKLNRMLGGVDNEILRGIRKVERGNPFNAKMKEILNLERQLIIEINKRKMDF